jgi:hypothetical protein
MVPPERSLPNWGNHAIKAHRGSGGTPNDSNCRVARGTPRSTLRVPSGDRYNSSTPDGALSNVRRVFLDTRDGTARAGPGVG